MQSTSQDRKPYLGSVRFFKHIILAAVALMILVPTCLSIYFGLQFRAASTQAAALAASLESVSDELEAMASNLQTADPGSEKLVPVRPEVKPLETEVPDYTKLYPELYAPEADRASLDPEKTVYLTFDDGPSARTPEILEILERYGVKATFFTVGRADEQSQQWMRDIVAAGHTLAVHSYSHDYRQIYTSVADYLADFQDQYELIHEATGVYPSLFRFPGGSINGYNTGNYHEIIAEMVRRGFVYFDWNVSSEDAVSKPAAASVLASNCLKNAESLRRAVVLMHDSAAKTTTVQALPIVIEGYQRAGFTFAALTPEVKPITYSYP